MSDPIARARWLEVQDELLRGITHALSNRLATLSASAYMLEFEDITCTEAAGSLRAETDRLDALLQLLRLLPSRDDSAFEPLAPGDVVEQAVALHAHHCDLRDVPVRVDVDDAVLPVWVEPHALLQALLLALSAAKRAAFAAGSGVELIVRGDGDEVRVGVHPDGTFPSGHDASTPRDVFAAQDCLRSAVGSAAARDDGGCELTLPTLLAVRRAGR
jgi:signal transduction histidine kinase